MPDYYRILRLRENASADEIKRAYRQLAREFHPDLSGDEEARAFRDVKEAFDTLGDEERRRRYDRHVSSRRTAAVVPIQGSEWFADEVALDFPSVSPLLDRIREALFGGDVLPDLLSAEILLTAREAFHGTSVPLDVPVRRVCAGCGGRGESWMEMCRHCAGTGQSLFSHQVQIVLPPGVRDGARFRLSVNPTSAPPTVVEVRIAIQ
jgi:molecular chaperone DnaJ